MPPTAHAGTAPAAYSFAALPVNVPLNGTASTVGAGATSIDEWIWALKAKPTGSTATIVGGSTPTPVLTGMDKPGSYVIWLRVRNDLNEWSAGVSAGDDGGDFPDAWSVMPTSIIVVEAETANLGLVIKAESEHDYWTKDEAWFLALDALKGESDSAVLPVSPRTKWVQAHDGEEDADGSISRPFNPISAAAEGYSGPWDQAIAALVVMDVSDEPRSGLTIVALGGVYNENVAILLAQVPWTIIKLGDVQFNGANSITYTADVTANLLASPHLTIDGPGSFVATGAWALGNPSAETWQITVKGPAVIGAVSVSGSFLAGPAMDLEYVTFTGAVNVPNLSMSHLEWAQFPSALTCKNIQRAINCKLDDVTVTQAATVAEGGFFSCAWTSAAVFDGPAGSAKFDPVTAGLFAQALGTYAGAATDEDTLYVGNVVQADEMLVRSNVGLILEATTADLRGSALAGDVDFLARGAGNFAKYAAEDGDVWLDQNGAARKIDIDAEGDLDVDIADAVTLDAGGTMDFASVGNASLQSTGTVAISAAVTAGQKLTATTGDGNIEMTAGGASRKLLVTIAGTAADALDVDVSGGADVGAASDILLRAGTGATDNQVIARGGTGADLRLDQIERDTVDGGVEVLGRGTHAYDLKAEIAAIDKIIDATGGAVTIEPTTGFTVNAPDVVDIFGGDEVQFGMNDFNLVKASRVVQCLDAQIPEQATTGTAEELLDSYTIPEINPFFTIPGLCLEIDAVFFGAGNTNNKTYTIKFDGNVIGNIGPVGTSNDNIKMKVELGARTSSTQRARMTADNAGSGVASRTSTSVNMATGDKVIGFYATTPTSAGDATLERWSVRLVPTTNN